MRVDVQHNLPGLDARARGPGPRGRMLSCPVFGRPDAVKAGNALFVCAGDPAAKEQARSSIRNMPIGLGGP